VESLQNCGNGWEHTRGEQRKNREERELHPWRTPILNDHAEEYEYVREKEQPEEGN
jgi:hypothetical protein